MVIFKCDNCGMNYTTPTSDLAFVVQGKNDKYTITPWIFPGGKDDSNPMASLCVDCVVWMMSKI